MIAPDVIVSPGATVTVCSASELLARATDHDEPISVISVTAIPNGGWQVQEAPLADSVNVM